MSYARVHKWYTYMYSMQSMISLVRVFKISVGTMIRTDIKMLLGAYACGETAHSSDAFCNFVH